jgi:hypothetical protein
MAAAGAAGTVMPIPAAPEQYLHDWLEIDRDRHSVRIYADHCELWWVGLYIDHHLVSAAAGYDLGELLREALAGMVIPDPGGLW